MIYSTEVTIWAQLDAADVQDSLQELSRITDKLDADKRGAVNRARALGFTWHEIGAELNMSRQAAWERWHRTDPPGAPAD